jgi:hypothetical protein
LEDRLGPHEPPYKSRGEAQVGRLLDRYGIPFLYEHPLVVYDRGRWRTWHPDFTLPNYGNLIVEYAGMPDRPDYMAGVRHKEAAYAANGVPALFIYPVDLAGPVWPQQVVRRIGDVYRMHRSAIRYPARSEPARFGGPRLPYSRRFAYRR